MQASLSTNVNKQGGANLYDYLQTNLMAYLSASCEQIPFLSNPEKGKANMQGTVTRCGQPEQIPVLTSAAFFSDICIHFVHGI